LVDPKDFTSLFLFCEIVYINHKTVIKITQAVFKKLTIFGAKMPVFIAYIHYARIHEKKKKKKKKKIMLSFLNGLSENFITTSSQEIDLALCSYCLLQNA
jgi:hypothetical protein